MQFLLYVVLAADDAALLRLEGDIAAGMPAGMAHAFIGPLLLRRQCGRVLATHTGPLPVPHAPLCQEQAGSFPMAGSCHGCRDGTHLLDQVQYSVLLCGRYCGTCLHCLAAQSDEGTGTNSAIGNCRLGRNICRGAVLFRRSRYDGGADGVLLHGEHLPVSRYSYQRRA